MACNILINNDNICRFGFRVERSYPAESIDKV